ncbi:flagellar hook-basal body complex protein [Clostridium sp. 29_15]|uniref:flagellar hook-basal body complex protein n=1 Tax=Clostridium sp. 29_15 TaxID=1896982 RepID=UPI0009639172|nr:flagellar hook-basal body complex protein [Clostridium sp. 29_15]OKZ85309.1 MAG: flagellar basal body rod protein FlgG [Clostridium sp. 29_15]
MLTTLWTSKSGLNANQEKLDVISNNIANVNTTGYKKVNVGFKDLISSSLDEWGNPLNDKTATVGSGVKTGNFTKDNSQGGLQTTNQKTDLALDGEGYFKVISSNGTEYYTRDGSFKLDSYGRLVTANGNILEVQYANGYSQNNTGLTADNFTINKKGEIFAENNGNFEKVGEIAVYTAVGNDAFTSVGDNLFKELNGVQVYRILDADMYQGYLEASNVDLSQEMTDMIVAQRAFQLSSKGITAADEMWQMINNLR